MSSRPDPSVSPVQLAGALAIGTIAVLMVGVQPILLGALVEARQVSLEGVGIVAMAEIIHSPERAQAIVCRMGEKESGVSAWIRAAIADGRLRQVDPEFAGHQLQGLVDSLKDAGYKVERVELN